MLIDISELVEAFPEFRVAVVVATGLSIPAVRPEGLAATIAEREAAARARWGGLELAEIPGVKVWRVAYKRFGIKRTSYRSSVERIVKNVLAGRTIPEINGFVDAYNAVSLAHVFPLGADDLDRLTGDIAFRYARGGDSFVDMAATGDGGEEGGEAAGAGGGEGAGPVEDPPKSGPVEDPPKSGPVEDPPKPGEVVFADDAHVLCRRWNWRQDARSLVSPDTTRALLTVQSFGTGDLEAAVADVADLFERFCSATVSVTYADRAAPRVSVAGA